MTRELRLLSLAAALASACRAGPAVPAAQGRAAPPQPFARPNVLLITIDALRADHLGAYGYRRATSPRIDALAQSAALFEQASTYWPKTRGSFATMLTGRTAARNGYSARHPGIADFNPTLASALRAAGYRTAAVVDNPNVARVHGYSKGFDSYRETWEEAALATEVDRTRAITAAALREFADRRRDHPFFLWLHYVNPHAPYTPPPPYDAAFLEQGRAAGPELPVVDGVHDGIHSAWAVPGQRRLGYYVAQYDGEIATVDTEVGRVLDALSASAAADNTVVVLTSDHGESLGEHGYYFDHGEDLFDPCLRIPLIVRVPGAPGRRRSAALATSLDIVPTILDAVKVPYPPDLSGRSLLPAVVGAPDASRERLFAQNDRGLAAALDARFKLVATPTDKGAAFALYDRDQDPRETRPVRSQRLHEAREGRRELELYLERAAQEAAATQRLLAGSRPGGSAMSREACEKLEALGYVAGAAECEGE